MSGKSKEHKVPHALSKSLQPWDKPNQRYRDMRVFVPCHTPAKREREKLSLFWSRKSIWNKATLIRRRTTLIHVQTRLNRLQEEKKSVEFDIRLLFCIHSNVMIASITERNSQGNALPTLHAQNKKRNIRGFCCISPLLKLLSSIVYWSVVPNYPC